MLRFFSYLYTFGPLHQTYHLYRLNKNNDPSIMGAPIYSPILGYSPNKKAATTAATIGEIYIKLVTSETFSACSKA